MLKSSAENESFYYLVLGRVYFLVLLEIFETLGKETWDIGTFFLKISLDTEIMYVWIDKSYLVIYINIQKRPRKCSFCSSEFISVYVLFCLI